jgi:hypothetical protein
MSTRPRGSAIRTGRWNACSIISTSPVRRAPPPERTNRRDLRDEASSAHFVANQCQNSAFEAR